MSIHAVALSKAPQDISSDSSPDWKNWLSSLILPNALKDKNNDNPVEDYKTLVKLESVSKDFSYPEMKKSALEACLKYLFKDISKESQQLSDNELGTFCRRFATIGFPIDKFKHESVTPEIKSKIKNKLSNMLYEQFAPPYKPFPGIHTIRNLLVSGASLNIASPTDGSTPLHLVAR